MCPKRSTWASISPHEAKGEAWISLCKVHMRCTSWSYLGASRSILLWGPLHFNSALPPYGYRHYWEPSLLKCIHGLAEICGCRTICMHCQLQTKAKKIKNKVFIYLFYLTMYPQILFARVTWLCPETCLRWKGRKPMQTGEHANSTQKKNFKGWCPK